MIKPDFPYLGAQDSRISEKSMTFLTISFSEIIGNSSKQKADFSVYFKYESTPKNILTYRIEMSRSYILRKVNNSKCLRPPELR